MRSNTAPQRHATIETHEGGKATPASPWHQLRRSVLSCFLFEDTFYEKGTDTAARIAELVRQIEPEKVAALAIEARERMYLRHVPLFLVRELARQKGNGKLVADTLARVIQRADELTEYLAIYYRDVAPNAPDAPPLSAGSKRGLDAALRKFNEYALAKYDRAGRFRLRDVLRLVHPKPSTLEQTELWGRLIKGEMKTPDTWEVALSTGGKDADKQAIWTRLLTEKKLGGLALLRNLRNIQAAGVERALLREALVSAKYDKVLPFRFIAASKYAPELEDALEQGMLRAMLPKTEFKEGDAWMKQAPELKLPGRTVLLIDVSGSMDAALSAKSDLTRLDAACGLAILLREICEEGAVCTFSDKLAQIPSRRGFALRDAIVQSQPHSSTHLAGALRLLRNTQKVALDRIIVITDEQSQDGSLAAWLPKSYLVNVATYKHGVSYGNGWQRIDGWSERIVDFVIEAEAMDAEEIAR